MAISKSFRATFKLNRWSSRDLIVLRRSAGRLSTRQISELLDRSPGAIRFKAHIQGISLRIRPSTA